VIPNTIKRWPICATGVTKMTIRSTAAAAHSNGTRFIIKTVMILAAIPILLIKVAKGLANHATGVTIMPLHMIGAAIWTRPI
jgi:hypothetical protein